MTDLQVALKAISEQFGKGSLAPLGSDPQPIGRIKTGCRSLDAALGGGIGKGRVTEIFGNEATGKTTLLYSLIASVQAGEGGLSSGGLSGSTPVASGPSSRPVEENKTEAQKHKALKRQADREQAALNKPPTCVFIDTEHALDPTYAQACGVNTDTLLLSQPDSAEEALEIGLMMAESASIICLDSIASLVPRAELEGTMDDQTVGLQPRLVGRFLRNVASKLRQSDCALVMTNQIRINIGAPSYMSPEIQPGGKAPKFMSSQRVRLKRVKTLTKGDEVIGSRIQAEVVKNKTARPFLKAEYDLTFGHGIDAEGDLLDTAVAEGVITRSGKWHKFENVSWDGREEAKMRLKDPITNEKVLEALNG